MTFKEKLRNIPWVLILVMFAIAIMGFIMLYSAAGGSATPWAAKQFPRFMMGLILIAIIAFTDIRLWVRMSYWIYAACFLMLIAVSFIGVTGLGAKRWLDLGFFCYPAF